jgi:RNase P/RNase MRP subunit p30
MKKYSDLHLAPTLGDLASTEKMARLVAELGFSLAGLSVHARLSQDVKEQVESRFEDYGVDVAWRIDIVARSRYELLNQLRRNRGAVEIVAVQCQSENVALVAARDGRVDLLYFDPTRSNVRFREKLAHSCSSALELQVGRYASHMGGRDVLFRLRDEARIAAKVGVKTVLTSGARSAIELRGPHEMAAFGIAMGLPQRLADLSVTHNPLSIVGMNRRRLDPVQVERGVQLLQRAG